MIKLLSMKILNFIIRIKYNFINIAMLFKYSVQIGRNCHIDRSFSCGKNVKIGEYTRIGLSVTTGNNVKIGAYAYLRNIDIGDNSQIEGGVKITGHGQGKITIGKESYIGLNNILDFSDNITIGDYVHIAGPSTGLWTHSSVKQALAGLGLNNKAPQFRPVAPIIIENNVYIGGNSTIYPGVIIRHHSIIAPNSAVTKDVESHTMVGGVPAKFLKWIDANKFERKI